MSYPHKNRVTICPHGKRDGKTSKNPRNPDNSRKTFDVSGQFCKNNCERYKAKDCKRWFK